MTKQGAIPVESKPVQILFIDASRLTLATAEARAAEAELTRAFPNRSVRRVLFVVPPDGDVNHFSYTTCKLGRYPNFPAYGVGTIATHLRQNGIAVDILHLNNVVLKACRLSKTELDFDFTDVVIAELTKSLRSFLPDVVGVTCMFSQTHQSTVDTCKQIKQIFADVPIVLGGVHVTNSIQDEKTRDLFLGDFSMVEFFFMYECDSAFPSFIRVVNQKDPLTELAQVMFNGEQTKLHFTNRCPPKGETLDVIPAHDLVTLPDLAENGKIGSFHCYPKPDTRFSTVLSNRGCRAQCTFCSVRNFNGIGVRRRSVQSVIDELLMLRQEYGVGHIMWLDDDFLYDHKSSLQLFNEMVRQNVGITWDCTNGVIAFSCTDELMAAAAESGCVGLHIGMESGNPTILRQIRKPGTVEIFLRAAQTLHKYERINARVFVMLGFPHETFRMIKDTFDIALEMDLDWYMITPLQPLPNTPIFGQMAMEGLIGTVTFDEIRYQVGAHGAQRKSTEKKINVFATDFKNIFADADLDSVPTKSQINRLWAYMNYHLNFARLFGERRPVKHLQMYKYLEYIADVVAPDDAFAQYFLGYLYWKVHGQGDSRLIERLRSILLEDPHWHDRLDDFNLSIHDLITGNFPDGEPSGSIRNRYQSDRPRVRIPSSKSQD
jgi:radical SAM superfamily enzyme YgiQ (UPF0313 family)